MRDRQHRAAARHGDAAREIANGLRSIQAKSGHNLARIWDDWISSMALAIANKCDRRPAAVERREAEYMQIVKAHKRETMFAYRDMLHAVIRGMDTDLPFDLLGSVYMALELGSSHAGQFFTPTDVCTLMVRMAVEPEDLREIVERDGFVTTCEPSIGGGAIVLPVLSAIYEAGLVPFHHLHVVGIDVDYTVLRMAYVQLSLLGVPAVLYVGDTLRMQMRDDWFTPAHVAFGWGAKLRRHREREAMERKLAELGVGLTRDQAKADPAPVVPAEPAPAPSQGSLFDGW